MRNWRFKETKCSFCINENVGVFYFLCGFGIKDLKKKKKKEEDKKKTAGASTEQKKTGKKVFDLPGQKRDPPAEVHCFFLCYL